MEAVVPFCPLCQISFARADMTAYVLSCNHPVCSVCLNKQSVSADYYQCYFDWTYTAVNSIRELKGLAWSLNNEYLEVVQITMGMQAIRMDEILRSRFNIYYERTKIPCRTRNCALKCGYDHTNRFYKKTNCNYGYNCPNAGTCIFLHPGESTQTSTLGPSSTPRPSALATAAASPVEPPCSSAPSAYDPLSYYGTVALPRPCPNHYSPDLPTVANSWQCPNCQTYNTTEVFYCQCTFARR